MTTRFFSLSLRERAGVRGRARTAAAPRSTQARLTPALARFAAQPRRKHQHGTHPP